MVGEMTWRKFPRDLQTNENFTYIESKLKPVLAAAPYMFYITALRLADDDGIFDLEDGVIFSRLMKIGTPDDVFIIANYMQIRRIITRVSADSNRCFINDWDYPKNKTPRTMQQRREIVMKQIEEDKRRKSPIENAFTVEDQKKSSCESIDSAQLYNNPAPVVSVDLTAHAPAVDFFCPENDKNSEIVVKENIDDKTAEIVGEKNETEREKERDIERLKETHTENSLRTSCQVLQLQEDTAALAGTEINNSEIQREESVVDNDPSELAEEALAENAGTQQEIETLLNDWFVKNCLGYKPNAGRKPISELAKRINALASEMNPPDVIANVMLRQFKDMNERDPHWQNIPLLPAYMVKDGVYAHVMARASKILLSNNEQKKIWAEQMSFYTEKTDEECAAIDNGLREEFVKYNIDPNDPNRTMLLLAAKSKQQGGTSA